MRRWGRVQSTAGGWKSPPWISGHRTRGAPASGLQRVIYVIYGRNDIYGRSVIYGEKVIYVRRGTYGNPHSTAEARGPVS